MGLKGLYWLCQCAVRWLLRMMFAMLNGWLKPKHARRKHHGHTIEVDDVLAAHNVVWARGRRKPRWISDELVRMKAHCPKLGYIKLADAFNRRFAISHGMTVSKSTVERILKMRRHDVIQRKRDCVFHAIPVTNSTPCRSAIPRHAGRGVGG
jgi:hypothetical protein